MSKPGSKKVEAGEIDATLLASAGLKRLGIDAGTVDPDRNPAARAGPGGDRHGMPHQRHRDAERADDGQQPDHLRLRDGRARLHPRARRDLRVAGRGLLRCSRTATSGCARNCSARTAARWSRSARCSTAATTRRPPSSRATMLAKAPEVDPEAVRGRMTRVRRPAPRARRKRDRCPGAPSAASMRSRSRCSRSSRWNGRCRTPASSMPCC